MEKCCGDCGWCYDMCRRKPYESTRPSGFGMGGEIGICFHNPPVLITEIITSDIESKRPTVSLLDPACSKFKERGRQ